ncbi:hypothetical protein [Polyangium sp. 15x6]|uniref:hypothetical protein n=1 Tax=Polyangium sp. 15x6 TaxID=3042687 RepID=UPI00249AB0DA|nr:hypothetical protein [Polyangium sp. 15x6]MDI3286055.1 hypothetical protein [Polyangium sp. 15x6]
MKKYAFLTLLLAGCIADLSIGVPEPSEQCNPEGLDVLLDVFPTCDLGICGDLPEHQARGRCVDDNQLGAEQLELLAPCANTAAPSHCVPVELVVTDGLTKPPVCESIGGAEGRCMSICVPQIHAKQDQLPQDVCEDGKLCAPCYDPFTGESSGACDASVCDAPVEPPVTFPTCCEGKGGGSCAPRTLVPDDKEEKLGEDSCGATPEDDVCVPTGFGDTSYVPPTCDAGVILGEGRCLPTCIPLVSTIDIVLSQKDCPEAFQVCVPCSLNGDYCN